MVRQKELVTGVPMDFMVRTPDEWQRGFPLKKEIVAEGKIIYCPNRGAFLLAYATTAPTLGRLRIIICA
ncbi:hypothetical protein AYW79_02825 [Ferroacidibacillus organovorans]|uniref:Uncharacterized protein n=1 Tax=Ferroacidibacillus organovorans TaxID=1765683 RepID=A0A853KD26_9BACL|nr:hypothetical protein AYJ22_06545 [Ferroacidibacillus organovorans]OAG94936.1 hypothetical protein AYW79_02825 [Ferroacidibacillus organovorans]